MGEQEGDNEVDDRGQPQYEGEASDTAYRQEVQDCGSEN